MKLHMDWKILICSTWLITNRGNWAMLSVKFIGLKANSRETAKTAIPSGKKSKLFCYSSDRVETNRTNWLISLLHVLQILGQSEDKHFFFDFFNGPNLWQVTFLSKFYATRKNLFLKKMLVSLVKSCNLHQSLEYT